MQDNRMPNRLIHEASPYLQQHAYNPVDWYPWGPEALAKAKTESKPIFLSIGYSSCHWCHVMERESFENPEIAAILNEHFVPIKVDREERPDLDQIYQTVCQMVTRHGGWPLSVWLTPDQKPFYVGTYYPPTERYGRPGFKQVLIALNRAYHDNPDEIAAVSQNWTAAIARSDDTPEPGEDLPDRELFDEAVRDLAHRTDRVHGGFAGAPKFPNSFSLDVLLRDWKQADRQSSLDLVTLTLRKMAQGGVYDQLGGGFHRYSVDDRWAVPHFEKMLYDNASLPPVYLSAWQATGEPYFRQIAEETLQYVMRAMTHPEGGFYSTTDADSEGEEGKFFVFNPADVAEAVGPALADLMCRHYGVTQAGNFEHTGKTVLHIAITPEKLAEELDLPESELRARLAEGRAKMLAYREQRVPPFRDEKVLTAWNGLMIAAFARAGRILRDFRYVSVARAAAQFVLLRLTDPDGGLLRRFKNGNAGIPGYLEDYAYFAAALLDLYEATFEEEFLEKAIHYCRESIRLFYDGKGGFTLTAAGGEPLIHQPKDATDSATPAAASVMALTLLRLIPFTGDDSFRESAEAYLRAYQQLAEQYPSAMGTYLQALDLYLDGPAEVTLVGDTPEDWLARLGRQYIPNLVLTRIPDEKAGRPIWEGKARQGDLPTVYVCRDFACSPPATEWIEAEGHLQ